MLEGRIRSQKKPHQYGWFYQCTLNFETEDAQWGGQASFSAATRITQTDSNVSRSRHENILDN